MEPLQLLSLPSHISGEEGVEALQTILPPWQVLVPCPQEPGWPVEQVPPPPGLPSSVLPSQSLSLPSHFSEMGVTSPAHEPHFPAMQPCTPSLQVPLFLVDAEPE
jgi:hypothetical protein